MPSDSTAQPILHQVLVYEDPLELVRTIGEFTVSALERGDAVVLIARREYLEEASEWLRLSESRGEPEGSTAGGRYQTFDVEDVINELDRASNPADAIGALLDTTCERLPSAAGVVHIFEDLAATLWERNRLHLAGEIEQIGTQLAEDRGVSIACAYPASALREPRYLESVRRCHNHVIPRSFVPRPEIDSPARVTRSKVFPASIPACRAARQFVRSAVEEAGRDEEVADAAELICSELAANAVRHARSVFTVRVGCGDQGGVCVAVADETDSSRVTPSGNGSDPFPVRTARGLGIVSALSLDWGVADGEAGKTVWAELGRAGTTG